MRAKFLIAPLPKKTQNQAISNLLASGSIDNRRIIAWKCSAVKPEKFQELAPMSDQQFQSVDVKRASEILRRLHQDVVLEKKRVELFDSVAGLSVIISKEELEGLERALAILSNTNDVREMAEMLKAVARRSNMAESLVDAPAVSFPA
jgi:hypothetical protein